MGIGEAFSVMARGPGHAKGRVLGLAKLLPHSMAEFGRPAGFRAAVGCQVFPKTRFFPKTRLFRGISVRIDDPRFSGRRAGIPDIGKMVNG